MNSRFGKIAVVVLGVVLMILLVLPAGLGSMMSTRAAVAEADGQAVGLADINQSRQLYSIANRILLDAGGQDLPLPAGLIGQLSPEAVSELARDPELFLLLGIEARSDGIDVPMGEVARFLEAQDVRVVPLDDPSGEPIRFGAIQGEALRNTYLQAAKAVFDVFEAGRRRVDFVKFSTPVEDYLASESLQEIRVRAQALPASDYLTQVPEPDDQAVTAQFEAFADVAPGVPGDSNPFGFGYRKPDRVTLDYLVFPRERSESVVVDNLLDQSLAARSAELFAYWQSNRNVILPPSTPTTQPSTQPTTRPLADLDPLDRLLADENPQVAQFLQEQAEQLGEGELADEWAAFVEAHDPTVRRYVRTEANRTVQSALRHVRDVARSDFRKAGVGGEGVTYRLDVEPNDPAYLSAVADYVEERDGLRPDVVSLRRDLIPVTDLTDADTVGDIARAALPVGQGQFLPLSLYVASQAEMLLTEQQRERAASNAALLLEPLEPSEPMLDAQENLYIFRLIDIVPDEPARELDEVREAVVADLKIEAAYGLALAEAERRLADGDVPEQTSTAFVAAQGPAAGETVFGEPPLPLAAQRTLARELYALFPPADDDVEADPGVIGLPAGRRVLLAQVTDVEPVFQSEGQLALLRARLREQLVGQGVRPAATAAYFDRDRVTDRLGYDRDGTDDDETPSADEPAT
jgi:hypothetical protein